MFENNNIKNNTDIIGFLVTIIKIPDIKDIIHIRSKNIIENPLKISGIRYKPNIILI